jgi:hypothetical protein
VKPLTSLISLITEDLTLPQGGPERIRFFWHIPRSRQNPKILWVDDAEVDRITKACPVLGDFVAQESVRELSACGVAFVMRDISVHEAP